MYFLCCMACYVRGECEVVSNTWINDVPCCLLYISGPCHYLEFFFSVNNCTDYQGIHSNSWEFYRPFWDGLEIEVHFFSLFHFSSNQFSFFSPSLPRFLFSEAKRWNKKIRLLSFLMKWSSQDCALTYVWKNSENHIKYRIKFV